MPIVDVPQMGTVEFPDDMTEQEMSEAIETELSRDKTPSTSAYVPPPGGGMSTRQPFREFRGIVPTDIETYNARAAIPEEQALQAKIDKPLVNLPQELYEAPVLKWLAPDVANAMGSRVKEQTEAMTSPAGLAAVPYMAVGGAEAAALKGASVAGRLIASAFGVQGIAQLPEAGKRYVEAVKNRDREEAAKAWVDLAAASVQSLGIGAALELRSALSKPPQINDLRVPVEHETVLPNSSDTFSEITGSEPQAKGAENASSQQSAATLHGPLLRVGESARRENEAGLPVNEGGEGIRGNEVQEPAVARSEEAVTPAAPADELAKYRGEVWTSAEPSVYLGVGDKVTSVRDAAYVPDGTKGEIVDVAPGHGGNLYPVVRWENGREFRYEPDSLRHLKKEETAARLEVPTNETEPSASIAATVKPTEPGIVGMGGASEYEFPKEPPKLSTVASSAMERLQAFRKAIVGMWKNADVREDMAVQRDVGDNQAGLFGRERANDIRGELRRIFPKDQEQAEKSLSFVVEAKGDYDALDAMREKLIDSERANPRWRKEAVDAIDWAKYHWEELQKVAEDYNAITDDQVTAENAAGIDTLRRSGYVMHAQDIDAPLLKGGGEPTAFKKVRTHDTFSDSIAAGVDPKSLNSVDLLQSRITSGQRMLNSRAWMEGLKELKDYEGNPIATDFVTVERSDGSTYQQPPKGYHSEMFGRTPVAVRDGFEGIFHALTDPSAWSRTNVGKAAMQIAGGSKSLVLAIDTFHLGRIAFWDSLIKSLGITTFKPPFPSYKKGVTLLDTSLAELNKMADAGEIPKKWLPELVESKRRLDLAVSTGFNVGRIADALYNDVIHSIPVLGDFNRFLFDQFQRGAMAESWLLEFERIRRARPSVSEEEAARIVSQDLNTRFGNLGRQGILKGRTAQDTARILALAPQWNEGLIRSELGAAKEALQFLGDSARGRRIYAGILLRSVGGMIAAQFVANQIINYATRGHPTWENKEEGLGAKISAWIPDLVGTGPGFFLHPLGLAAETTHLLLNAYARTGDFQKTLNQYLRSRASVAMRPVLTFITNSDFLGRSLKPGTVWWEMAKEAAPVPIGASGYVSAAKQISTGKESETFPGQIQKQVMSSVGIKTEQAPGPGQRISKLAEEYNKAHGVEKPQWQGPVGDYSALTSALRIGNMDVAKEEMDKLLEKRRASEIAQHYRTWPRAAFTGRRSREGDFVRSLDAEQHSVYNKAVSERVQISKQALSILRQQIAAKRQAQ